MKGTHSHCLGFESFFPFLILLLHFITLGVASIHVYSYVSTQTPVKRGKWPSASIRLPDCIGAYVGSDDLQVVKKSECLS